MLVHRITPKHQSFSLVLKTPHGAELWLGDYYSATNLPLLRQKAIRSVLTVAALLSVVYAKEQQLVHRVIQAIDLPTYKMSSHFEESFHFISNALTRGNVLVHCAAGDSRSPALVIAYLMRIDGMGFQNALDFLKKKRPVVCPNEGFQQQLRAYESTTKKMLPFVDRARQRQEEQKGPAWRPACEQNQKELRSSIGKRSYSIGPVKSLTSKLFLCIGNTITRSRSKSLQTTHSQGRLSTGVSPRQRKEERRTSKQNKGQDGRLSIRNLSRQFLALKVERPRLVILKK